MRKFPRWHKVHKLFREPYILNPTAWPSKYWDVHTFRTDGEAFCQKRVCLIHENARPHVAASTGEMSDSLGWKGFDKLCAVLTFHTVITIFSQS